MYKQTTAITTFAGVALAVVALTVVGHRRRHRRISVARVTDTHQSSFMDRLPSNIILDIFSRVPVKYLARSRCVSKVWFKYINDPYLVIIHGKRLVEEPTPILYHEHLSRHSLCFHVIESKQSGTTPYVLEPREGPFLEYLLSKYPILGTVVQGCCNGLMCLSLENCYYINSLVVVHPLRKECYELPPLPMCVDTYLRRESCGLGFDTSTNTFKMVCVLLKDPPLDKPVMVKRDLCTMVHVFGTNSWREIPAQVPSYIVTGKAVFANGYLHWLPLVGHDIETKDGGRPVIWFDVNKEQFGFINPPKRMCFYDRLVDLNGEVGYVCCRTMEFWLLNHKKEWVPQCRFKAPVVPNGYVEVLGCWNKDGDMLIKNLNDGRYEFFVYNLKSGVFHQTNIAGSGRCPDIFMYQNTLSSIRGINTNSFPMKKIDPKNSCRDLLSFC